MKQPDEYEHHCGWMYVHYWKVFTATFASVVPLPPLPANLKKPFVRKSSLDTIAYKEQLYR